MKVFFVTLALSAAVALAQDNPAPMASPTPQGSPTPEATATPSTSVTPAPANATAGVEQPTASPEDDIIPLPPEQGTTETPESEPTPAVPPLDAAAPDEAFTDPNALIPPESPEMDPAFSAKPKVSEVEKARKQKLRYAQVRIEAEKNPQVAQMLARSEAATTIEDKRAALREYYRLLFARIKSIDKDLTKKCDALEAAYIRRLAQDRIEPTIPLNPPPTPEPLAR